MTIEKLEAKLRRLVEVKYGQWEDKDGNFHRVTFGSIDMSPNSVRRLLDEIERLRNKIRDFETDLIVIDRYTS